jgi:hypothetical protein
MKTWYTKKKDDLGVLRIDRVQKTDDDKHPVPADKEWFEAPNDWGGNPNDALTWFDKNMYRITDEELVKQGKRKDNRNKQWFKKDNPSETKLIYSLDEEAGDDFTDLKPLQGEDAPYQFWNETKNKWDVDKIKKNIGEKQKALNEIEYELDKLDKEYLTPRILSNIPSGDEHALGEKAKHEKLAAPLREKRKKAEKERDEALEKSA